MSESTTTAECKGECEDSTAALTCRQLLCKWGIANLNYYLETLMSDPFEYPNCPDYFDQRILTTRVSILRHTLVKTRELAMLNSLNSSVFGQMTDAIVRICEHFCAVDSAADTHALSRRVRRCGAVEDVKAVRRAVVELHRCCRRTAELRYGTFKLEMDSALSAEMGDRVAALKADCAALDSRKRALSASMTPVLISTRQEIIRKRARIEKARARVDELTKAVTESRRELDECSADTAEKARTLERNRRGFEECEDHCRKRLVEIGKRKIAKMLSGFTRKTLSDGSLRLTFADSVCVDVRNGDSGGVAVSFTEAKRRRTDSLKVDELSPFLTRFALSVDGYSAVRRAVSQCSSVDEFERSALPTIATLFSGLRDLRKCLTAFLTNTTCVCEARRVSIDEGCMGVRITVKSQDACRTALTVFETRVFLGYPWSQDCVELEKCRLTVALLDNSAVPFEESLSKRAFEKESAALMIAALKTVEKGPLYLLRIVNQLIGNTDRTLHQSDKLCASALP